MEDQTKNKKHLVLKILLSLLPTVIFWQNYSWMTLNAYIGIAFIVIWALMVWCVWQLTEKNHILERIFRLTEISFFLLPVSAIVFTFVEGARAVGSTSNQYSQAGAAIGTAIGGTVIVVLAFIIGIIGGIIMHIVTGKYDKKAESSGVKEKETFSNKHGLILSLVGIIILAIIFGSVSAAQNSTKVNGQKSSSAQSNQNTAVQQTPAMQVTATQLAADYKANQVAADAKYKGKVIEVSGTIDTIGEDIMNNPYVSLDDGDIITSVQCSFNQSDQAQLASLQKGAQINLEGTVQGDVVEVSLNNCSIVK